MMNFTQNFKLTLRRMSRKWNIYAVASMIFLIPTILSTILSLVANSISLYKTSASSTSLMLIVMRYAMGLLSDDMIIENQIDINLMQRTMLQIMPYIIASAVVLLLAVFVALPGAYYFIRVARKENASIGQALKLWLKSVPVSCLTALLTFLWGLLFILPGIIKGIAYSQALNIKADNPEYSAMECVRRSNEMMNGRKGKCFLLFLIHSGLLVVIRYGLEYILSYLVVLIMAFMPVIGTLSGIIFSSVIPTLLTLVLNVYYTAFKNTSLAIFYEDAKRSYVDDIEQTLRNVHENGGREDSNPFGGNTSGGSQDPFGN